MTRMENAATMLTEQAEARGITLGTEEAQAEFWDAVATERSGTLTVTALEVTAYLNLGRWVGDCPVCSAGIALSPDQLTAACMECLYVYSEIVWPADIDEIEDALIVRPANSRNWTTETVAELLEENFRNGYSPVVAP